MATEDSNRLTPAQRRRYNRHIILDGFGEERQRELLSKSVLIVGAGGLGSPAAMYLAAAGVGTIKAQGYTVPNLESAFGVGVLRKRIILPDRNYTAAELHYILLHEYTHFLDHDTVIKLMVTLFCMIFWWNPVVYLLRKDLEQTLEINRHS